jgi:hypothetical protein
MVGIHSPQGHSDNDSWTWKPVGKERGREPPGLWEPLFNLQQHHTDGTYWSSKADVPSSQHRGCGGETVLLRSGQDKLFESK